MRVANKTVLMSNVKLELEWMFRRLNIIKDDESVKYLSFGTVGNTVTVVDWNDWKTIPIQIIIEKEVPRLSKIDQIKEKTRKKNSGT